MRVLVTGGAGFIGSRLGISLIDAGHQITVVDNLSTGRIDNLHPAARFYHADIIDAVIMEEIISMEKPEIVFHLAAQTSVPFSIGNPLQDAKINILGSINLIESSSRNQVKKMVYFSSAAVYGKPEYLPLNEEHPIRPQSGYGISKHTVEHYLELYCQLTDMKYMVFRCANVYGERQDESGEGGVVSIFIKSLLNNKPIYIHGEGEQTRDFIYVQDVIDACLQSIEIEKKCIINISTGEPTSINELLSNLHRISQHKTRVENIEVRPGDIRDSVMSNQKAQQILHWKPKYSLEQGLESMWQHLVS
jgi:UDP-glucose 4-epimerase